jgi:hypothetical protein
MGRNCPSDHYADAFGHVLSNCSDRGQFARGLRQSRSRRDKWWLFVRVIFCSSRCEKQRKSCHRSRVQYRWDTCTCTRARHAPTHSRRAKSTLAGPRRISFRTTCEWLLSPIVAQNAIDACRLFAHFHLHPLKSTIFLESVTLLDG